MKTTMAEGGGGKEEGNPFSFRKFFKDQTGDESNRETDFALPDVSNTQTRKTPRNQQERKQGQCDVKCKKSQGERNPFSFKKFLQTGESDGDTGSGHHIVTLDLANDLPDFVDNHQTVSTQQPVRLTRSDCQLPDFTRDLQTRSSCSHERGSPNSASEWVSRGDRRLPAPSSCGERVSSRQRHLLDTSQGEVQLPDFTQKLDTVQSSCGTHTSQLHNHLPEVHLPDFALKLLDNCTRIVGNDAAASTPAEDDSSCMHEHCSVEVPGVVMGQSGRSLPDFLSDYPVSLAAGQHTTLAEGEDQIKVETNSVTTSEFIQLQAENTQLRQDLREEREKVGRQTTRLREALGEVEVIRQREMDETAALENMVQQVEANLITTTRRAVNAETSVRRLEEEVTSLQRRVQTLQCENDTLHAGCSPTDHIKEQVKSASKQLSQAADQAELTLQQLLTGVQTIKLMSTSLASIGKMSEVNLDQFEAADDVNECGASGYSAH